MKGNAEFEEEFNKVLGSLDNLQPATPGPYFITRVLARLEHNKKSNIEIIIGFISKPIVALVTICIILVINSVIFFSSPADNSVSINDNTNEQPVDAVYNTYASSLYDMENPIQK